MELVKGANAPVAGPRIEAAVSFANRPAGLDVDVSLYLLTQSGRVRGDDDMLFYNQPEHASRSVRLDVAAGRISIDAATVPADIERIAVCVVVDGGSARTLGSITLATDGGPRFAHDVSDATEAAIIVGEYYRRSGQWKMRAVGQGFNGGLGPLARSFGMDVTGDDDAPATPAPPPAPAAPPAPAPVAAPAPAAAPVSLKKVTLEKAGRVDLSKGGGAIRARLVWEGRGGGDGDLDLYCFYVLQDGTCGKVYWKDMGRDHAAPWITLSGDSKRAGEEEAVIHHPERLRYALFAAYSAVGNGVGSFESFRPKLILTDAAGSEVTIPLLNPNRTSYWVAISHISVGDAITIQHVETYGKSGVRAFIAAERAPRLHADGTWDVSKGPVEFKRS